MGLLPESASVSFCLFTGFVPATFKQLASDSGNNAVISNSAKSYDIVEWLASTDSEFPNTAAKLRLPEDLEVLQTNFCSQSHLVYSAPFSWYIPLSAERL